MDERYLLAGGSGEILMCSFTLRLAVALILIFEARTFIRTFKKVLNYLDWQVGASY